MKGRGNSQLLQANTKFDTKGMKDAAELEEKLDKLTKELREANASKTVICPPCRCECRGRRTIIFLQCSWKTTFEGKAGEVHLSLIDSCSCSIATYCRDKYTIMAYSSNINRVLEVILQDPTRK